MPKGRDHAQHVISTIESRSAAAVSSVAASWCRSAFKHGLDPEADPAEALLSDGELARRREANDLLLRVARPVLDSMYRAVVRTGCCLILTDSSGAVLESRTTAGDAEDFVRVRLIPGAVWSEAQQGTNGIGTCLADDRPVTIHRDQHFRTRNIGISCTDAPVHDHEGRLIGALDVSTCRADHDETMAALVASIVADAAQRIERDYFCSAFRDARIVFAADASGRGPALLAVDRDDLVIGASRAARQHFGLGTFDPACPILAADLLGGQAQGGDLRDAERTALRQALARANGNVTKAASMLGIGRATFYRRVTRARAD